MTSFSPTVEVDRRTVTPPNWMWVLAFALRGFPWAVTAASTPEFDRIVREWHREQAVLLLEEEKAALEQQVAGIEAQLARLRSAAPGA